MKTPQMGPETTPVELLEGFPPWITKELVEETLRTWQPRYNAPLTRQDAVEMLLAMGRLLDALS